jgi:excisionase family DNA binding protein
MSSADYKLHTSSFISSGGEARMTFLEDLKRGPRVIGMLPDQAVAIDEVCKYIRIPHSSLYKLTQESRIPCQKVGRHWRFRKAAINRWLDDEISVMGRGAQTPDGGRHGN